MKSQNESSPINSKLTNPVSSAKVGNMYTVFRVQASLKWMENMKIEFYIYLLVEMHCRNSLPLFSVFFDMSKKDSIFLDESFLDTSFFVEQSTFDPFLEIWLLDYLFLTLLILNTGFGNLANVCLMSF